MKKNAAQIHNELVDRIEIEKEYLKEFNKCGQTPSDYQIGYYDALCIFLKWIEDGE
jgi:hypothetical protein